MSKYIIELGEEANMVQAINVTQNGNVYVNAKYVTELKELTSDYINEHYGQLQQDAYDKGYKDGRNVTETQAHNDAYQRGLDDAWEAARKISLMSPDEIEKVFPGAAKYNRYNLGYSGVEAIEKLKAYEEKQKAEDKIEVGDEVIYNGTTKCVVVTPETDEKYASLFDCNGIHYSADHRECKKTGRHFDIASILEDMRND